MPVYVNGAAVSSNVPTVNGTANNTFVDVIGSKDDTHDANSLYGRAHTVAEHFHKASQSYPDKTDGIAIASSDIAWGAGTGLPYIEIVPASTITSDFDIHEIILEAMETNAVYQCDLYYGDGNTFAGSSRFVRETNKTTVSGKRIQTPIIPANSKVTGKLFSSTASSDTAQVSLYYHTY